MNSLHLKKFLKKISSPQDIEPFTNGTIFQWHYLGNHFLKSKNDHVKQNSNV